MHLKVQKLTMKIEAKKVKNLEEAKKYLNEVPLHTPVIIPKENASILSEGFEKTSLGYTKEGELAQYRGPENIHVHEFADYFELHKDNFDPRNPIGAIGHAFVDAPEIGFGILAGLASGITIGKDIYKSRKDKSENALEEAAMGGIISGIVAGGFAYLIINKF